MTRACVVRRGSNLREKYLRSRFLLLPNDGPVINFKSTGTLILHDESVIDYNHAGISRPDAMDSSVPCCTN